MAFSYPKRPHSLESHCRKLLSACNVFGITQQRAEFSCFSPLLNITSVSSVNVGVLCFRFIDDKMPLQKTTRRESLDLIQEHFTVADKVNVVSIRNVVWHIDVLSRALWQVVSQIAKGSVQVDNKEYR